MGLLSWLFGTPTPQTHTPSKPTPTSHLYFPPARTSRWRFSEKGNPTFTVGDFTVTVFRQDGGWKYVIVEELDDGDEDKDFSRPYPSQDEAKIAAMTAFLDRVGG